MHYWLLEPVLGYASIFMWCDIFAEECFFGPQEINLTVPIILLDQSTVMTGSYNWTHAAEHKNAENLLIIKDEPHVFERYVQNFEKRKKAFDLLF